jgi:hypothetical protein
MKSKNTKNSKKIDMTSLIRRLNDIHPYSKETFMEIFRKIDKKGAK